MTTKPPFSVTGMRWTVLILALWNILRFGATLATWTALAEFAPRPGPLYIAFTASFWTLACLAVAEVIRRRNVRSRQYYALAILGYIAWWWADYLIFQQPRSSWPFALAFSGVFLFDTIATYFNKVVKDHFTQRESYDQQPSHQQTS